MWPKFLKNPVWADLCIAIVAVVVLFAIFAFIDGFELIYELTREYEDWELDEYILVFFALPIPGAWYAYRRTNDARLAAVRRTELEKQLAHSRRLESLGILAGGVAHELNNQLLPIMTMADSMCHSLEASDPRLAEAKLILAATERARNTVAKILSFSRFEMDGGGEFPACDVAAGFPDLTTELQSTCPPNVSLKIHQSTVDTAWIAISSDDLKSIVVNLFSNAVDALDKQPGNVSVAWEFLKNDDGRSTRNTMEGPYVQLTVTDDGIGVSDAVAERMFDPFYTTKLVGEGVGLGLSIVYSIITAAGGDCVIEPNDGKGTKISILLPTIKPEIDQ